MMRIVYFAPLLATGGTQRHLQQVLGLLDGRRFAAEVLTLRAGGAIEGELRAAGVPVSSLDMPRSLAAPATWRAIIRAAQRLRANRVEVVHGYQWRPALVGVLVARLARVPLVLASKRSLTGTDASAQRAWRRIARSVDTVLVNARALQEEGERLGMRCRWSLLRNGIDVGAFALGPATAAGKGALGLAGDRPVIGAVGRLEWRKGHDVLVEAMGALAADGRRPQLLVVGDGPAREALVRQAETLGVASDVRFTGTLDDVRPALAAMDVFVLPSREEGMSNALMEAMAAGRPIVATDVGGNGEVLERGRHGILVRAGDAAAIADAIRQILAEPATAEARARDARAFVGDRWGARRMVGELEAFYEERMAVHRRAA
jgi:glycosyltransferase involved in cell wall biosynthesis